MREVFEIIGRIANAVEQKAPLLGAAPSSFVVSLAATAEAVARQGYQSSMPAGPIGPFTLVVAGASGAYRRR